MARCNAVVLSVFQTRTAGLLARVLALATLAGLALWLHPTSFRHALDAPLWLSAAAAACAWIAGLRQRRPALAWAGYYAAWMALTGLVVHGHQPADPSYWSGLYTVGAVMAAVEQPALPAFLALGAWGMLTHLYVHLGAHPDSLMSPSLWVTNGLVGAAFAAAVVGVRRLQALYQQTLTDPLTGIGNRRAFYQTVVAAWEAARARDGRFSVLLLDLDHFKAVNDHLGHEAGDRVLREFAREAAQLLRPYGTLCRYGGDEFAAALPDVGLEQAAALAEQVKQALAAKAIPPAGSSANAGSSGRNPASPVITGAGGNGPLTVSVGVAAYPEHGRTPEEVVRSADRALLYGAKLGGRNRVAIPVALPDFGAWESLQEELPDEALALLVVMAAITGETADHVLRVATLAEEVGRLLGLHEAALRTLRLGCVFHDVGKVVVPRAILDKPGPLSELERQQVRRHAALGALLVANLGMDPAVVAVVRHHHERWDGTGYPDRLRGEAIPLPARILAVADAYDAMTTPRPYRPPMAPEQALEELRRAAGTQFDPRAVDALCRVVRAQVLGSGAPGFAGRKSRVASAAGSSAGSPATTSGVDTHAPAI